MQDVAEVHVADTPSDFETALAAVELLRGSDVGFAVYDAGLKLLACNSAFRDLRGLREAETKRGMSMRDIIEASVRGDKVTPFDSATSALAEVERLKVHGSDSFKSEIRSGAPIRISRNRAHWGGFVETVQAIETVEAQPGDDLSVLKNEKDALDSGFESDRLLQALQSMSDGFAVFDSDGVLKALNQRYRDLAPHVAHMLRVGNRHEDIIRAVYRSGKVDLEDYDEQSFVDFATRERLKPGEPTTDQLTDGRWVRFSGRRLKDGSTIFLQSDITEMKQQELRADRTNAVLKTTMAQMESAIEAMHAGFIMFDGDQKMVVCNTRYREMLGFPDGIVRRGVSRQRLIEAAAEFGLFNEQHMEESSAGYRDSLVRRDAHSFRYFMADGRVLQVRFTHLPDGGSIVLFIDISEELENQERLVRYSNKLERSNSELQNFAYVASHDLQEPLRKIEAFGDRLVKKHADALPESGQHYVSRMQDATWRMRQLINDLLAFSRVSSKERSLEKIELSEVLEGVLSDIQVRIEETGARIEAYNLGAIEADTTQMRQLLQNLIGNALKFSREGVSPVVRVSGEEFLEPRPNQPSVPMLRLRIADNGIGFEDRFKEQIFTIFQRLHGRNEYEGTGIGLATVRKIVERHNGTIDAEGVPGEGATFIIELPLTQPERED